MKRLVPVLGLAFVFAATLFAQDPPPAGAGRQGQAGGRQGGRGPALPPIDPPKEWLSANRPKELIEFDMMTWPEVYDAIHHQGKTVALYYTGGTEHRGPQNVNGGHTLMARETVKEIARRLGNAIVLPVIPYSQNDAGPQQTGHARPHGRAPGHASASASPSRRSPTASRPSCSSTTTAAA